MKKLFAIAFFAIIAVSCSKKETVDKETNVMLEEPKVENVKSKDSATTTQPVQPAVAADSTATK